MKKIFFGFSKLYNYMVLILLIQGFTIFSLNAQTALKYQWKNVKIGGGGFVTGIVTCPTAKNLIYIRTDVGGAYRYQSGDTSWIPLQDWVSPDDWLLLGTESIAIDPADPKCLYMACGMYSGNNYGVFLRSTDKGDHFERSSNITPMGGNDMGRSNGERLIVDPNKGNILLFGSRKGGLWMSIDSAKTWNTVAGFPVNTTSNGVGTIFIQFLKSSSSKGKATAKLFAGVSQKGANNLYFSTDSGTTWLPIPGQPTDLMPQHMAIDQDSALYVTYSDTEGPWGISSGKVWRYSIPTATWNEITPSARNQGGFGGVCIDFQHPGTVMVSTMNDYSPHDLVFRSLNNGKTWTELLTPATYDYKNFPLAKTNTIHWTGDLQIDPFNPDHVMITTGYGLWSTFNATNADLGTPSTWLFTDNGIEETVPLELACQPSGTANLLSAIGDFDGFRHDNLDTFPSTGRFAPNHSTNSSIDFAELNPNIVVRVCDGTPGAGYYSMDGGITWTVFPTLPVSGAKRGYIAVSADGSSFVWTIEGGATYYTLNKGTTWTLSTGAPSGIKPVADRVNPKKFYMFNTTVYRSTDYGKTFSSTTVLSGSSAFARAVPGVEGDLWVPEKANGLVHSTNSGTSFITLSSVQSAYAVAFGKAAPSKTYPTLYLYGIVNNVKALFRSDDKGVTWNQISDDAHQYGGYGNAVMAADQRIYGRVFVSTGGRGIVYGEAYDCNGDLNGTAYKDNCDVCVGGNTGNSACSGTAVLTVTSTGSIILSPNPFEESIHLSFTGNQADYIITNVSGQKLEAGTCKGDCNLGDKLKTGFYFIKVSTKNETGLFKVVKK